MPDADERYRPSERLSPGSGGTCDTGFSRRAVLASAGVAGAGVVAGCLGGDGPAGAGDSDDGERTNTVGGTAADGTSIDDRADAAWRTTELTAVRRDETFTVDQFDGPVVLETFAVWCRTCERQQARLADVDRDDVTVVSLNVDSNEDADLIASHADDHGFDWRFAVAPSAVSQSLWEEFGTDVTNPPSAPVVVACQDGSSTFMAGEVNTAAEIEAAAEC